jgi:hypothetical protein
LASAFNVMEQHKLQSGIIEWEGHHALASVHSDEDDGYKIDVVDASVLWRFLEKRGTVLVPK